MSASPHNVAHHTVSFTDPIRACGLVSPDGSYPAWAQTVSSRGRVQTPKLYSSNVDWRDKVAEAAQLRALRAVLSTPGAVEAIECLIARSSWSNRDYEAIDAYLAEIGAIDFPIGGGADRPQDRGGA